MPYKDPKSEAARRSKVKASTAWRERNRDRDRENTRKRKKRNKQILIEHLGGKCVGCGTTEDLQFDHIVRADKSFTIGSSLTKSIDKLISEADKCRLLCTECHRIKTRVNEDNTAILKGYELAKVEHIDNKIIITYETNTNQV